MATGQSTSGDAHCQNLGLASDVTSLILFRNNWITVAPSIKFHAEHYDEEFVIVVKVADRANNAVTEDSVKLKFKLLSSIVTECRTSKFIANDPTLSDLIIEFASSSDPVALKIPDIADSGSLNLSKYGETCGPFSYAKMSDQSWIV